MRVCVLVTSANVCMYFKLFFIKKKLKKSFLCVFSEMCMCQQNILQNRNVPPFLHNFNK